MKSDVFILQPVWNWNSYGNHIRRIYLSIYLSLSIYFTKWYVLLYTTVCVITVVKAAPRESTTKRSNRKRNRIYSRKYNFNLICSRKCNFNCPVTTNSQSFSGKTCTLAFPMVQPWKNHWENPKHWSLKKKRHSLLDTLKLAAWCVLLYTAANQPIRLWD